MAKPSIKKTTVHVSLPTPLAIATKALAELDGREIGDVFAEALRNVLRARGISFEASADDISAQVKRLLSGDK